MTCSIIVFLMKLSINIYLFFNVMVLFILIGDSSWRLILKFGVVFLGVGGKGDISFAWQGCVQSAGRRFVATLFFFLYRLQLFFKAWEDGNYRLGGDVLMK